MTTLKRLINDFLHPCYNCEDCVGAGPHVSACYCAYYDAMSPGGPGPSRLIRALRWIWEPVRNPAWMKVASVYGEWQRTMRDRPYDRAYEVPDYSDWTLERLQARLAVMKWEINSAYGRFAGTDGTDWRPWYDEAHLIRLEISYRTVDK